MISEERTDRASEVGLRSENEVIEKVRPRLPSTYLFSRARSLTQQSNRDQGCHDRKKIDELNQWGSDSQKLAHKQLAGEAPIDNTLTMLKPLFPAVAARAHVALIVPELDWTDNTVTTVDVIDLLLDQLQATPRTRKVIEELRKSHQSGASN